MATYKVLQDIEAEDKLVGPFSLRQFIYAAIAIVSGFIAFKLATVNLFLITPFLPVVIFFAVLAAPFGHDQPSEVWLLARVRFFLKPHKRIWNQTGAINLVSITVPKVVNRHLTNGLSQNEVTSRLHALANTIDSRGWAIKNVSVNLTNNSTNMQIPKESDRLVDPSSLPQDVPNTDVTAADDMLDARSNPTAKHLDKMINEAAKQHRQQVINSMTPDDSSTVTKQSGSTSDYWFMNNDTGMQGVPDGYAKFDNSAILAPVEEPANSSPATYMSPSTDTFNEEELLKQIEHNKERSRSSSGHMHTVEPLSEAAKQQNQKHEIKPEHNAAINDSPTPTNDSHATPATTTTDPAIINLAMANSNNWSVATIARQADEAKKKEPPQDEVIISLH